MLPPSTTDWLEGEALSKKSGVDDTTSVAVVVWLSVDAMPVMVSGYVPGGVLVPVAIAKVDEDPAGLGLKLAVAPVGKPLTLNVTWLVKPPVGVIVMP